MLAEPVQLLRSSEQFTPMGTQHTLHHLYPAPQEVGASTTRTAFVAAEPQHPPLHEFQFWSYPLV